MCTRVRLSPHKVHSPTGYPRRAFDLSLWEIPSWCLPHVVHVHHTDRMANKDEMIPVVQAAEMAGVSRWTVQRLARDEKIKATQITARMWLVSRNDVIRWFGIQDAA